MRSMSTLCLFGVCIAALISCQSNDSQTRNLKPAYDEANGKLRELSYDSNNDGRADMKAVMDGGRVLKAEVDENGDGRPDRWEYYDKVDRDVPVRIERATRLDGKVTRTEGFKGGALVWVEEDRDGDGKVDRWESYVDGALATLALDTRGSGTPDRRITYLGDSVRIEQK